MWHPHNYLNLNTVVVTISSIAPKIIIGISKKIKKQDPVFRPRSVARGKSNSVVDSIKNSAVIKFLALTHSKIVIHTIRAPRPFIYTDIILYYAQSVVLVYG